MILKASSKGRTYEYVHLCESVWKNGRSSRRTVVSLGRKDVLDAHLDRIYELCRGTKPGHAPDPVPLRSFRIGPFLALRRLWQRFDLPRRLGPLSDRALVLVANRLAAPASEHGLADWLRTWYACDSRGRRFAPAYRSEAEREASTSPRVRVQAFQLQRWYRTLDGLLARKERLEEHLFDRLRSLFAPNCDLVFHDLTSTCFEGAGPDGLARHGHSRDKRPGNPQVLVGVAMVDGLPVSHTVLAGNRRDCTTVQDVIEDLRRRFGLGRFVFVGDRGMKSAGSLQALEEQGLGYLMAVKGRRSPDMEAALKAARPEAWEPCEGWDGKPKANGSRVQEVTVKTEEAEETEKGAKGEKRPPVRRFLVHSPEREQHERGLRKKQQEKVRERFKRLQARVERGDFERAAEKERAEREKAGTDGEGAVKDAATRIGEAAGRIVQRDNGWRYYDWRLDAAGQLEYFENEHCAQEKRREGHWLLETEEEGPSAVEAVRACQDLWRVEAAFRTMKDVLELRPVWHRSAERVRAAVDTLLGG